MNNEQRCSFIPLAFLAALGLIFLPVFTGRAQADNCPALAEKISKERVLLIKKKMIEEAMQACPRDVDIVYQHGYTLERLRKYGEALKSYKKTIALDQNYSKAYFSIGDVQMVMKNYQDAADAYVAGLRLDPGDVRAKDSLKDAQKRYHDLTGKNLSLPTLVVAAKAPAPPPAPVVAAGGEGRKGATVEAKKVETKKVEVKKAEAAAPTPVLAAILRLRIPFQNQTTDLSQDAKDVLAVVVGRAMQRPEMAATRLAIAGYTDNLGDPARNLEISTARAEVVKK